MNWKAVVGAFGLYVLAFVLALFLTGMGEAITGQARDYHHSLGEWGLLLSLYLFCLQKGRNK